MDFPPISDSTTHADVPGHSASGHSAATQHVATVVESAVIETRVMGAAAGGSASQTSGGSPHTLKVVRFESLARCGEEIWIENEGELYRLRKTRQGKLILTK